MGMPLPAIAQGDIEEIQSFATVYDEVVGQRVLGFLDIYPEMPFTTHVSGLLNHVSNEYASRTRAGQLLNIRDLFIQTLTEICGAINGVNAAASTYLSTADKNEQIDIVRNSFGVLAMAAIDKTLLTPQQPKKEELTQKLTIKISRLTPSRDGKRIVVNRDVARDESWVYDGMPCPAFRGEVPAQFRLPYMLWDTLIDIYALHGEFDQRQQQEPDQIQ